MGTMTASAENKLDDLVAQLDSAASAMDNLTDSLHEIACEVSTDKEVDLGDLADQLHDVRNEAREAWHEIASSHRDAESLYDYLPHPDDDGTHALVQAVLDVERGLMDFSELRELADRFNFGGAA